MEESLKRYLNIKIHPSLQAGGIQEVHVIPVYNREGGISPKEKRDKLFNYKRPTVFIHDICAKVYCFPGYDYVFHYSNIISTYFSNYCGQKLSMRYQMPSESDCVKALKSSSFLELPHTKTIIVGYVEGLDFLSTDSKWNGVGDFLWKRCSPPLEDTLLVGVKHTLWGEIAGRLVKCLAEKGVLRVIYTGKLGTLCPNYLPNEYIATGSSSTLPNGNKVVWDNLFGSTSHSLVINGDHITMPSVLQETKAWRQSLDETYEFGLLPKNWSSFSESIIE